MIYLFLVKSMHISGASQTSFYSLLSQVLLNCSFTLATNAHLLECSTRPKTSCIKRDDGILTCILMGTLHTPCLLAYCTRYCLCAYFFLIHLLSTYLIYMNYLFGLDESGFLVVIGS